ncbi:EAL domain-containing protein [Shewanella psychrophila]|uniref:EAL domain-containing protein n=2 Tax=Shewanella psychrophila TaxID=225848 RepID=A0A1S6HWL2_9GAMM|nr:EAL domain-containing protein [Shewanella psychrophila]
MHIKNGLIKANTIKFEITERLPIKNFILTSKYLGMFYELGVTSVIDDIGTGYGTFLYLNELGARGIKIDKYFIDTINSNGGTKILDAIINLANNLELEIIAEGVETDTQQTYLLKRGVYLQQGYLFSQPLNAESFRRKIVISNIKRDNVENNTANKTVTLNLLGSKTNTHSLVL